MPRACHVVMAPKISSNIPKQPHWGNFPIPWLIAQALLAINPARSGRLRVAAILGYTPRSKSAPSIISTQGRTLAIRKAMVGVQKEPRRTSINSDCPGILPAPDTKSISPRKTQGTMIINIHCRLLFNCGFGMPIELSSPSAY